MNEGTYIVTRHDHLYENNEYHDVVLVGEQEHLDDDDLPMLGKNSSLGIDPLE